MTLAAVGLTFAYHTGTEPVIRGLTNLFEERSITAVSGPSGGGKSTLMYLLALMLRPSGGAVVLDGEPISNAPDDVRSRARAATMGFVFQDAVLDPSRTVLDNVLEGALYAGLGTRTARARAHELLQRFGVRHRADHRPGEISGGQAQRVALCRALVKQPRVILADEPTGNLDVDSADVVWQALVHAAAEGSTVIVATHDRGRLASADRVLTL